MAQRSAGGDAFCRVKLVPALLCRAAAAALVLLLGCGSWLTLDAEAREAFTGWARGVYDTLEVEATINGRTYTDSVGGMCE